MHEGRRGDQDGDSDVARARGVVKARVGKKAKRPISRLIVALALLVLGAVAAWRLPLSFLPSWSFPELTVDLSLAQVESLDLATRLYLDPIESAIRSLGGVRDMLGEVNGRGGRFRVRFSPGVDVETKAARLDSELESLRRRLPERSVLEVEPAASSGGEMSNLVWLAGASNPRLVDAIRALPEVRSVEVAGQDRLEMRVQATDPRQSTRELEKAAHDSPRRLANLGQSWLMSEPSREALWGRPVRLDGRVVPLGSLADLDLHHEAAPWQAHVDGKPGQVLLISRHPEASPLSLGRSVRAEIQRFGEEARFLVDEAEPLVLFLWRLGLGLGLCALCLGFWGWRRAGLAGVAHAAAAPIAAAAALNMLWLSGATLDVTTLPLLAVAVVAALFIHTLRLDAPGQRGAWWPLVWLSAAAGALPVAVTLAGGSLGTLLSRPAGGFALALPAAALAIHLLPAPPPKAAPRSLSLLKWLLRRPVAVLLATVAVSYLVIAISGEALLPKSGRLSPAMADVILSIRFAEGTTVEEAEEIVERAESLLGERAEIKSHWSVFTRYNATLGIKAHKEESSPTRLIVLSSRLELQLRSLGASIQARPLGVAGGGEPLRFDDRLIEPPEVDAEVTRYSLILRSPDSRALREAFVRLEESRRSSTFLTNHTSIVPDWGPPAEQWMLAPRRGVDTREATLAAAAVAERARWPAAVPTLGLRGVNEAIGLRVLPAKAPKEARDAPELDEALRPQRTLSGPRVPEELFDLQEVLGSPSLKRQRGSFVLPVTIYFRGLAIGQRPDARTALHSSVRSIRWPAGVDRQLPRLFPKRFSKPRMRMIAIASTLPLLLLGLAICRLDSIPLGLATAIAPGLALVATMPLLHASKSGATELTWLALSATLAAIWALSAEVAASIRIEAPSRLAIGPGYRWMSRRIPAFAAIAIGWMALLALPSWGLASDRHVWVTALRTSGLAGAVGTAGACLLLPVLLHAVDRVRFHDRKAHRRRLHPTAWQDAVAEVPGVAGPAAIPVDGETSALDFDEPGFDEARFDKPGLDQRSQPRLPVPSPPPLFLETKNLCKIYGNGFQALSQVDLSLEPGIIGLLGPNGAGKSTLLRCLCGLLEPTRGQVLFRGEPVTSLNLPRYRRLVGFLPQAFNAFDGTTVEAFLDYWALEIGLLDTRERRREIDMVLEQVDLTDARARKVRELSGGMRRRIGIARALLGSPPILIVDEPTTGLDVESRQRLRDSLLRSAGHRIILFSTHIASDIATTAARILILDRGRLGFDGTPDDLIEEARGRVFERLLDDEELREFSTHYRVTTRVRTLDGIRVRAVATVDQEPAGELVRPNLEEAYLAKLSHGTRAPGGERQGGSLLDLGL